MLIAQISDLHIKAAGRLAYGVVDTANLLQRCVTAITRLQPAPDLVLATGDLVDYGLAAEYELLKSLLAPLSMPVYLVAGNHDERRHLRAAFVGPGFEYLAATDQFIQYQVQLGALCLLVLDTVAPMEARGQLCSVRLRWLEQRLSETAMPTIIAMHHPPFVTGIAHMDAPGFEGAAEFEEIVARHAQVERIMCGHLHRSIQCRIGSSVVSVCPSTAHQVALDLRIGGPDCFVMEPPGFQLHLWTPPRLITHTCVLGDFGPHYPFRHAGVLID